MHMKRRPRRPRYPPLHEISSRTPASRPHRSRVSILPQQKPQPQTQWQLPAFLQKLLPLRELPNVPTLVLPQEQTQELRMERIPEQAKVQPFQRT